MIKLSRNNYEEYLNETGQSLSEDEFIIGGKMRNSCYPNKYGKALRKHDNIKFDVGYQDWKRSNQRKW